MKRFFFIVAIAIFVLSFISCENQESKKFKNALTEFLVEHNQYTREKAHYLFNLNVGPKVRNKADKREFDEWNSRLKYSVFSQKNMEGTIDRECIKFVDDNTPNWILKSVALQTQDWFWVHQLWLRNRTDINEIEDIFPYLKTPLDFKEFNQILETLHYHQDAPCKESFKVLFAEKLENPQFLAELILLEWNK